MLFAVLFAGGGVMSYLTFGSNVQTVVIVNLDTTSKFTQSVRLFSGLPPHNKMLTLDRY